MSVYRDQSLKDREQQLESHHQVVPTFNDQIIVDFFGAGSVMGEMGILEHKQCNASVECETDVQVRWLYLGMWVSYT